MRTTLLAFVLFVACLIRATAGELVVPASTIGEVFTNVTFSSNITASVTFTNTQSTLFTVNHTFQFFYTATGTNSGTVNLDRTIDGASWIPVQTNVLTTASTNIEVLTTGKWWSYRWRVSVLGTNATAQADYMAE